MVSNICRCVSEGRTSIIFECEDSRPRDVLRQEVSWPARSRVWTCPGFGCISIQAMKNDDALVRGEL
jgi:hypothetical protein